jgi:hypothetical protein
MRTLTVGSSLLSDEQVTDPLLRQETQETTGRSGEARRIIIGFFPADPRDEPSRRESLTLQEKPRDSTSTDVSQIVI